MCIICMRPRYQTYSNTLFWIFSASSTNISSHRPDEQASTEEFGRGREGRNLFQRGLSSSQLSYWFENLDKHYFLLSLFLTSPNQSSHLHNLREHYFSSLLALALKFSKLVFPCSQSSQALSTIISKFTSSLSAIFLVQNNWQNWSRYFQGVIT